MFPLVLLAVKKWQDKDFVTLEMLYTYDGHAQQTTIVGAEQDDQDLEQVSDAVAKLHRPNMRHLETESLYRISVNAHVYWINWPHYSYILAHQHIYANYEKSPLLFLTKLVQWAGEFKITWGPPIGTHSEGLNRR